MSGEATNSPLRTDGSLVITFVGCGSAFARTQAQTNLIIAKGSTHVLVDCGTQCSRGLAELGLSILDIDTVLPTHSHADHVGGLEELLLMNRYVARRRPTMMIDEEYESILWNETLRGGCQHSERTETGELTLADYVQVVRPTIVPDAPRRGALFQIGDLRLRTFRTRHFPENATTWRESHYSLGLVIDERVVLSGDTQFDADLIPEVMGSVVPDAVFHDAQFFTGGIHASVEELATLPSELKGRMHLVHYADTWESHVEAVTAAGFAGFARPGVAYRYR